MSDALTALAHLLRADAELPAGLIREPRPDATTAPRADGARTATETGEYALVLEAVREGYLLHYGAGRIVATEDEDLALLAGDRLYALGLERLAALGDLQAVVELADLISLCARAGAARDPELAEAAWAAAAAAIAAGPSPAHRAAKDAARTGRPDAIEALLAAARKACANVARER